jgi:hypothetical protein
VDYKFLLQQDNPTHINIPIMIFCQSTIHKNKKNFGCTLKTSYIWLSHTGNNNWWHTTQIWCIKNDRIEADNHIMAPNNKVFGPDGYTGEFIKKIQGHYHAWHVAHFQLHPHHTRSGNGQIEWLLHCTHTQEGRSHKG